MDNVHFKPNGKDQLLKKIMKKDLMFRNEIFQMFLKILALPPPSKKKGYRIHFQTKLGIYISNCPLMFQENLYFHSIG